MIAYKFLRSGARGLFSRQVWPLPEPGRPGAWLEAAPAALAACRNGIHVCRVEDLAYWIAEELWEVELDGEQILGPDAIIARRARLLRRVTAWDGHGADEFASGCLARAEQHAARASGASAALCAAYTQEARTFAQSKHTAVVAFAAALAASALAQPSAARDAFRLERSAQAQLLAGILQF